MKKYVSQHRAGEHRREPDPCRLGLSYRETRRQHSQLLSLGTFRDLLDELSPRTQLIEVLAPWGVLKSEYQQTTDDQIRAIDAIVP